jgi:nicotinamide phosphoribosyltransferase
MQMRFNPAYRKDFYKAGHKFQYVDGTTLVYSNLTARGTRRDPAPEGIIVFGPQYWVLDHLQGDWTENFFEMDRDEVIRTYKRRMTNALGPGMDVSHIGELHELGYLPLLIKSLPEGTLCPYRVPMMTMRNTEDKFFWLTNMLETDLSSTLCTTLLPSATTAFLYRRGFEKWAKATGASKDFVKWQGHDFSMRGLDETACIKSGAAHLLSFFGTDTIPAIDFLETYYGANSDVELVGGSVPATEHSVMCLGLKDGEFETFKRLITQTYPKGIVSVVSDTWDFWKVLTDYLPALKDAILARDGKVVIRPDSGDPVKIILGDPESNSRPARMGAIRLLHEVFGGVSNGSGYIELDSHIGLIYGDSITLDRQEQILSGLAKMGFASSNVVLGIGSYTYQNVTRDTDGWAIKATYGVVDGVGREIFKDPLTDNGVKKSAKGLLAVFADGDRGVAYNIKDPLFLKESVDWKQEGRGLLQTIFEDGEVKNIQTLAQIRARVESQL